MPTHITHIGLLRAICIAKIHKIYIKPIKREEIGFIFLEKELKVGTLV